LKISSVRETTEAIPAVSQTAIMTSKRYLRQQSWPLSGISDSNHDLSAVSQTAIMTPQQFSDSPDTAKKKLIQTMNSENLLLFYINLFQIAHLEALKYWHEGRLSQHE
jgi:hypothetical protein